MVSIVVKALLLVHFLQLIAEVACQSCDRYVKYVEDDTNNKSYAKIKVQSPSQEFFFELSARISIPVKLPTEYVGQLQFIRPIEKLIQNRSLSKYLKYKLHFPVRVPYSSVTGLWFNNQHLCSAPPALGPFVTTITLNHTMQISTLPRPINEPRIETNKHFKDNNYAGNTSGSNLNCGRLAAPKTINPLIVRGQEISLAQWPWLVAIFLVKFKIEFICAGSLVTNRHVLTAAHCIQTNIPASTLLVALGRHRITNWNEKHSLIQEVAKYIIHPDYQKDSTADSDLAVLTLREKVQYNSKIRPICLWNGQPQLRHVIGTLGSVVGWGISESNTLLLEPQLVVSRIVSQKDCRNKHEMFRSIISNRTFCAGSNDGSGPCNGDSGSGFVIYENNTDRFYLRGIVSTSLGDISLCDLTQYVVYVDVAKYLKWIETHISTSND